MRKTVMMVVVVLAIVSLAALSWADDITLKWEPEPGATGYRIYRSVDMGVTWTMVQEVGPVTEVLLTQQPDTLTLYRNSAFNALGEAIRYDAGAFSWKNAPKPPLSPRETGIH